MSFRPVRALTLAACTMAVCAFGLRAQDAARLVADGGIHAPGWAGKIDAQEAAAGLVLNNARLATQGDELQVTTGPAVTYWKTGEMATGNYTVSATFHEPQYMNLNDHPHPYGIVIGGNDMGTDQQSLLYCTAYGNGTFIMRGFGPEPFQLGGRRATENAAENSAAGRNQPVTQEIAMTVSADAVSCSINGTVVATYPKSEIIAEGRLKSTDGVYGIRFAHNTEATVTGLTMTKH